MRERRYRPCDDVQNLDVGGQMAGHPRNPDRVQDALEELAFLQVTRTLRLLLNLCQLGVPMFDEHLWKRIRADCANSDRLLTSGQPFLNGRLAGLEQRPGRLFVQASSE